MQSIASLQHTGTKISHNQTCGRCGYLGDCYSDVIKDTFTNLDELRSPYICQACAPYFNGDLLKSAFYITDTEVRLLKQADFEPLVFGKQLEFPCLLSFSASRKKHRLYRARPTYSYHLIRIATDDGEVELTPADFALFDYLANLYNETECTKAELLTSLNQRTIDTIGMARLLDFRRRTAPYLGSAKYKLIVGFLNLWNPKQQNRD